MKHPDILFQIQAAIGMAESADKLTAESQETLRKAMLSLRLKEGMTARAFGALCGISKAYTYMLEKGVRPWRKQNIETIIKSFQ